jgi:hypothetical protein
MVQRKGALELTSLSAQGIGRCAGAARKPAMLQHRSTHALESSTATHRDGNQASPRAITTPMR